jgi:AraC family transcriptional regulator
MGEWLPQSGERVGNGVPFEVYRNDPAQVPAEQLRTDLFLPLA